MNDELPELGKLPPEVFEEVIYRNIGRRREEVVVPPRSGVDFGVIELDEKAIIVKTDPVFIVPEYGWDRSSWFAVHILASDVAVSGSPPMYAAIDLNLPKEMKKQEFTEMWKGISDECDRLGISIVAGHTGKYEGTSYPMIGGMTVISVAPRDGYVTTQMAEPGDVVIMTKGPAIEAAGIIAAMFPDVIERNYGKEFAQRASKIFYMQSVVRDAMALSKLGLRKAVTSMHDATEYGVWGALNDISEACGHGIEIYEDRLFFNDDVKKIIALFSKLTGEGADLYSYISEGTMIGTVKGEKAEQAVRVLQEEGIKAGVIGKVVDEGGVTLRRVDGSVQTVKRPAQDPFWPLFFKASELFKNDMDPKP
ncbi:MAG: AIR synthase family protein [Thermoprotei archaeon]